MQCFICFVLCDNFSNATMSPTYKDPKMGYFIVFCFTFRTFIKVHFKIIFNIRFFFLASAIE